MIQRIRYCFQRYDVVRIDHFRGFDEYYAIPYGEPTAENGTWMPGPGMKLFQAIEKRAWKTGNYCGRSRLSDRECPSDVERKWIPGNEGASVCI